MFAKKKKQEKNSNIKVCFAASSGGHFEQLMMLRPLMKKYKGFVVTERTDYVIESEFPLYELKQVNRRERSFLPRMLFNVVTSLRIFAKERPDAIVTTGVLAVIPLCLFCKLAGRRVVYIESFAKVSTPTETGKFMYHFADRFYVQWESMLSVYPNAIFVGGVY